MNKEKDKALLMWLEVQGLSANQRLTFTALISHSTLY